MFSIHLPLRAVLVALVFSLTLRFTLAVVFINLRTSSAVSAACVSAVTNVGYSTSSLASAMVQVQPESGQIPKVWFFRNNCESETWATSLLAAGSMFRTRRKSIREP